MQESVSCGDAMTLLLLFYLKKIMKFVSNESTSKKKKRNFIKKLSEGQCWLYLFMFFLQKTTTSEIKKQ